MEKSVVIPTYNRINCLRDTLLSILPSISSIQEVIIVDQSSVENAEKIESLVKELNVSFYGKIILKKMEFPSSTAARNKGMFCASGKWIIFCDDDVIWPEKLGGELDKILSESDDVVLIGGVNYENSGVVGTLGNADGEMAARNLINQKPPRFLRRLLKTIVGRTGLSATRGHVSSAIYGDFPSDWSGECVAEWAMGFFFVVNREFVMENGLKFDESLKKYAYAEDLDFTHRLYRVAKQVFKRCIFSPKIGVWHKATNEWRVQPLWLHYAHFMNRVHIGRKLYSSWSERAWFVFCVSIAEAYNSFIALRKGEIRMFFRVRFDYFRFKKQIQKNGWYFLVSSH